jgi:hypothetical protein
MSARTYASLVAPLKEVAIRAAWTQWSTLGFAAPSAGVQPGHAIVDPEALLLASLAFDKDERRLERVLWSWLDSGVRLLSASRMANLVSDYPGWMAERVGRFAADAVAAGDPRWKRMAGKARASGRAPAGRGVAAAATMPLRDRTTLLLRLRLAFGVGIKADALTYLVARQGLRATVREMASDLGYFDRAVRRAVEDLAAARFVTMEATSPVSFRVDVKPWQALLGFAKDREPLWRNWRELYAIVVGILEWGAVADRAGWTPYVAASRLRDAFESLEPMLQRASVGERPDWGSPPDRWLEEMEKWVKEMAYRLKSVA